MAAAEAATMEVDASAEPVKGAVAEKKEEAAKKPRKTPARKEKTAEKTAETPSDEVQKPKKAGTAYFFFSNEIREEVMKELKDKNDGKLSLGDIARTISSRWSEMKEADKGKYEEKAAADKERYEKEKKAYQEWSDPAGALREKYKELIPKKPMTAYFMFTQEPEIRAKAEEALKAAGVEVSLGKMGSKCAELWKATSEEEKKKYNDRHAKAVEVFQEAQKKWQATDEFKLIEAAEKEKEERAKKLAAEEKAKEKENEEKEQAKEDAAQGKTKAKEAKAAAKAEAKAQKADAKAQKAEAKAEAKAQKADNKAEKRGKPEKSDAKEPPAKAAKTTKAKPAEPYFDTAILEEATKLNLEAMFKNLASRPEIMASGKSQKDILDALKTSDGLVNPAKRKLLGN